MLTIELGKRIKELRKHTGLNQTEFSIKINMSRTYFADVEAGGRNIAIINLAKIAYGLDVSLSELFEGL